MTKRVIVPTGEIKAGWKIVLYRRESEFGLPIGYFSALEVEYAVAYTLNEWTEPLDGCGPLAVFGAAYKDSARRFGLPRSRHRMFQCEYEACQAPGLWGADPRFEIASLWLIRRKNPGTMLAARVQLIEEVRV